MENNKKIAQLNDLLRDTFFTGRVILTDGVASLPIDERNEVISNVQTYSNFTADNDPYGEHDFACFTVNNSKYFWKIDYYNSDMTAGSENPTDPTITKRVLTIMLAEEY